MPTPEPTRVLVVTGAGAGIGRAITLQASREGFAVVAVSMLKAELDELAAQIAEARGVCVTLTADVTAADTPARIVQTARDSFGRIDVLINNAGAAKAGALLEQSDAEIDAQWYLHVAAPLRVTRAAMPLLRKSGGQVMFVGSALSRVPPPYYGAYCAAKAAVRAMTDQLRRELHGTGVAVTFIDPGSVRTDFGKNAGVPGYDPDWTAVDVRYVARRVLRAVRTRQRTLNAVPFHTFVATLGEWFPAFVDISVRNRTAPSVPASVPPQVVPQPMTQHASGEPEQADFDLALEPVARRLERVKLPVTFLADLLRTGEEIQLADAAMRWAGMPNKNERAAMAEALDALTASGFLEKTGDERWRVLHSP
ncbi:MAG TPA: SDR family NAD(P)-dependent oxidoreductase [Candidatus Baltobacteraceae bacterium]|nr:SDR family NAD(P)-dependent oxidoreductase [Candidatus Baltobacteraceae bacterium]